MVFHLIVSFIKILWRYFRLQKHVTAVFGHAAPTTLLSRSETYIGGDCYIVSGSRDATLLLWYWNGRRRRIVGDSLNPLDNPSPRATLGKLRNKDQDFSLIFSWPLVWNCSSICLCWAWHDCLLGQTRPSSCPHYHWWTIETLGAACRWSQVSSEFQ